MCLCLNFLTILEHFLSNLSCQSFPKEKCLTRGISLLLGGYMFLVCVSELKKNTAHEYFCSRVYEGTNSFFAEEGSCLNSIILKCNNTLLSALATCKHISPNLLHPAKYCERLQLYTQNGLRKQNRV